MSPNELSSYLIIGAILFSLGLFTVLLGATPSAC